VRKVVTTLGPTFLGFFILLTLTLSQIFSGLIHQPLPFRMLVTCVVLFPSGLLLGMYLPIGLRAVQTRGPGYLPWAWGINGGASVYGSFAAIKLAIVIGFNWTLALGAASYLLALLSAWKFSRGEISAPKVVATQDPA
jgi:hypothetical protein